MADQKPKVLLVEDDAFMVSLLSEGFSQSGFEVLLAQNADEAVRKFSEAKPDALVVDILLPGKSGFEVLQEIRARESGTPTPAIILSNLEDHQYLKEAESLGVAAYLIKANTLIPEIVAKVKESLETKKNAR